MTALSAEQILACLPQTQCTQCGYEGCAPYAQAIAAGECGINRCPPGGAAGVQVLAQLTGLPALPIAPECGDTKPRHIAVIDPVRCIGCTLCISACPVDAIVGAPKAMHQVINEACTGCDLCLPPCPVDCIAMVRDEAAQGVQRRLLDWTTQDAAQARFAHEAKLLRLAAEARTSENLINLVRKTRAIVPQVNAQAPNSDALKAAVGDALARARARRSAPS